MEVTLDFVDLNSDDRGGGRLAGTDREGRTVEISFPPGTTCLGPLPTAGSDVLIFVDRGSSPSAPVLLTTVGYGGMPFWLAVREGSFAELPWGLESVRDISARAGSDR